MNLDIKDFLIVDENQNTLNNTFLSIKNVNEIKSVVQYIFQIFFNDSDNNNSYNNQIRYEFNFNLDISNLYKTSALDDILSEIYTIKVYYKDSIININKILNLIGEEIGYLHYDSGYSELVCKRNTKELENYSFVKVIFNEKDVENGNKNCRKPLKIYKNNKRL